MLSVLVSTLAARASTSRAAAFQQMVEVAGECFTAIVVADASIRLANQIRPQPPDILQSEVPHNKARRQAAKDAVKS